MLFENKNDFKGIESFDSSKCKMENEKVAEFKKDDVAMACSQGCWSGCIGGPHR